ncbi:MAG TPA: tetratricopeptide repeat protein [Bryobacteraceae bacterium]|nr:tetratricopeptide repeat protein [Bryobacteraceae bacterium]
MKLSLLVANLILSAAFLFAAAGKTPESMLGAALHQEEVQGDLKGAIAAYQKVVATPGVSRNTAAEALVRMGQCYEKLGSTEARKQYDRVIRDYADQKDAVARAQTRISGTGTNDTGTVLRKIWAGDTQPPVDPLPTVASLSSSMRHRVAILWCVILGRARNACSPTRKRAPLTGMRDSRALRSFRRTESRLRTTGTKTERARRLCGLLEWTAPACEFS